MTEQRFILIENNDEYKADAETVWYWDTRRPLEKDTQPYVAVQCYKDRNPNTQIVYHKNLTILYTDQAEYYFVCQQCRYIYGDMQWSGHTRGGPNWRQESREALEEWEAKKGWCEFCDPVFGNGGWVL